MSAVSRGLALHVRCSQPGLSSDNTNTSSSRDICSLQSALLANVGVSILSECEVRRDAGLYLLLARCGGGAGAGRTQTTPEQRSRDLPIVPIVPGHHPAASEGGNEVSRSFLQYLEKAPALLKALSHF